MTQMPKILNIKTGAMMMAFIMCLLINGTAKPEDSTNDGTLFALDAHSRLEVIGGAMVDNIATSRLIFKNQNNLEFEISRWTKDYNLYLKLGLDIPASGVYSGISIVNAKLNNGIVAAIVKYETDYYIVAAVVEGKKVCVPKILKDLKTGEMKDSIADIKRIDMMIEVSFAGGRKEMVLLK